ncbi:MAG: spore coat associated protein CotJA [Clostridia bacterium]|nr:spore coat associated protein CotJA [Clostridia bacterium]
MHNRRQGPRNEFFSRSLSPLPANYAVAMMYVPMQTDISMYDDIKALECGTLFPVLNKPFAGKCCK